MSNNDGEKLMKFGPEWLQNNLSRDSALHSRNNTNITRPQPYVKHKIAEYRYNRDELLALYDAKGRPPEKLKQFKDLYITRPLPPLAFNPRRPRIRRQVLYRTEYSTNSDYRSSKIDPSSINENRVNRSGNYRDFNRPVNNFQPRWSNEGNWKPHYLNKNNEINENWRNPRNDYQRNKWNEKKDRKDNHGPISINETFADDRNSPEDVLPEWANAEDPLEETGSFDSTGAFLPIVNENVDDSINETDMSSHKDEDPLPSNEPDIYSTVDTSNSPPINMQFQQEINILDNVEVDEIPDNSKKSDETLENICEGLEKIKFDLENSSISMVEDYLNKLVQEDDDQMKMDQNKNKILVDFPLNLMTQIGANNAIHSGNNMTFMESHRSGNVWYYRDRQEILRGPFTNAEMIDFCKIGYIDNFVLIRRGNGPHFMTLDRLFNLCGGIMPFLLPDHVISSVFNAHVISNNVPQTFIPTDNQINHPILEKQNIPIKEFVNTPNPLATLEQFNIPEVTHPRPPNNMYMEPVRLPFTQQVSHRRDEGNSHLFHQNIRVENSQPFQFPQFINQNQDTLHPVPNIPSRLENVHNWNVLNRPNVPWIDQHTRSKIPPYMPIPMPATTQNNILPNLENNPILNRLHDNFMIRPTIPNITNIQMPVDSNISPHITQPTIMNNNNPSLWNEQKIRQSVIEQFDYPPKILEQPNIQNAPPPLVYDMVNPMKGQIPFVNNESFSFPLYEVQIANKEDVPQRVEPIIDLPLEQKQKTNELINKNSNKKKAEDKQKQIKPEQETKPKLVHTVNGTKTDNNSKQTTNIVNNQQKKKNPVWDTESSNIPNSFNPKLLFEAMKRMEMERELALTNEVLNQKKSEITSQMSETPNRATADKEKFTWSITAPSEIPSFAEIQAQQSMSYMNKQAPSDKTSSSNQPPSNGNHQLGIWNSPPVKLTTVEGFWDTHAKNKAKAKESSNTNQNNETSKTQQNFQKTEKGLKSKVVKKEISDSKLTTEKTDNNEALTKLFSWAENELTSMSGVIDVPEFVNFLSTVESPYEVEDYAKYYLGDTKFSVDFAKFFIQRRSQLLFSKTRSVPCDDLCSPAPAYNPAIDKREEIKNKNKKKKGKMSKIDSRILGFNATAAENRFNVGSIEHQ